MKAYGWTFLPLTTQVITWQKLLDELLLWLLLWGMRFKKKKKNFPVHLSVLYGKHEDYSVWQRLWDGNTTISRHKSWETFPVNIGELNGGHENYSTWQLLLDGTTPTATTSRHESWTYLPVNPSKLNGRSKTHKRLNERFLIRQNRTKRAKW